MPIYEIVNDATGECRQIFRLIRDRDKLPYGFRRMVGAPLVKPTGGRLEDSDADMAVPRAIRSLTNSQQNELIGGGFSRDRIKHAWNL